MIDMNKTYRYRNGQPARVLCVNRPDAQPVVSMAKNGISSVTPKAGRAVWLPRMILT